MKSTLEQITSYKNQAVINRFIKEFPRVSDQAETLFTDLMRFFWASYKHSSEQKNQPTNESLQFTFIMDNEMKDIDHMWHVFLLYTEDYMKFCDDYFGHYLHHLPDVVKVNSNIVINFEENLERFLSYVYDNLGESVVRRWFANSIIS